MAINKPEKSMCNSNDKQKYIIFLWLKHTLHLGTKLKKSYQKLGLRRK